MRVNKKGIINLLNYPNSKFSSFLRSTKEFTPSIVVRKHSLSFSKDTAERMGTDSNLQKVWLDAHLIIILITHQILSVVYLFVLQKSLLPVDAWHLQTLSPSVTDERVRGNGTLLNITSYQSYRIISSFLRNTKEMTPSLTDSNRTLSSRENCVRRLQKVPSQILIS